MWVNGRPLRCPVGAYGFAALHVTTVHAVGPGDVVGELRQDIVHPAGVEAFVELFDQLCVVCHVLLFCRA